MKLSACGLERELIYVQLYCSKISLYVALNKRVNCNTRLYNSNFYFLPESYLKFK